ncbi:MAG: PfkB family carbohydrate kinase [Candidatus Brocadiia bacterium]|nr:PfkB family carbohydrate kinase [Candidatus Brocadiia bacterium]
MYEELHEFLEQLGRPRVCVIGDVVLAGYFWGPVARISPEGPIPVLRVDREDHKPGGAAGVAAMLAALGAEVTCAGVVGEDEAATCLREQLEAAGARAAGLVTCPDRTTTCRTRYLGWVQSAGRAVQQMLRVDDEPTGPIGPDLSRAVFEAAEPLIDRAEAVVAVDMGLGLFDAALLRRVIERAAARGVPVIVDPEAPRECAPYGRADCLLLNRAEAEALTGIELRGAADYARAGRALIADGALHSVAVKLDRDGIYFATAEGEEDLAPAHVREVADVTGAGDMVAAAFTLALAAGATLRRAAELANFAGGVEVTRHGAAVVSRAEMLTEIRVEADPALRKVESLDELLSILETRRARGEKVAFTNGCFDLLHVGHLQLIRFARAQADMLVVGINSDASARELKGPGRPVNGEGARARMLAGLADVDYVVVFGTKSVLPLVERVRPDVLVKGGDYGKKGVVGCELVESYGGRVELAPEVEGLSTSDIIQRIHEGNEGGDREGSQGDGAPA